jgi:hypothetical protein
MMHTDVASTAPPLPPPAISASAPAASTVAASPAPVVPTAAAAAPAAAAAAVVTAAEEEEDTTAAPLVDVSAAALVASGWFNACTDIIASNVCTDDEDEGEDTSASAASGGVAPAPAAEEVPAAEEGDVPAAEEEEGDMVRVRNLLNEAERSAAGAMQYFGTLDGAATWGEGRRIANQVAAAAQAATRQATRASCLFGSLTAQQKVTVEACYNRIMMDWVCKAADASNRAKKRIQRSHRLYLVFWIFKGMRTYFYICTSFCLISLAAFKLGISEGTHEEIVARYGRKGFGPVFVLSFHIAHWSISKMFLETLLKKMVCCLLGLTNWLTD